MLTNYLEVPLRKRCMWTRCPQIRASAWLGRHRGHPTLAPVHEPRSRHPWAPPAGPHPRFAPASPGPTPRPPLTSPEPRGPPPLVTPAADGLCHGTSPHTRPPPEPPPPPWRTSGIRPPLFPPALHEAQQPLARQHTRSCPPIFRICYLLPAIAQSNDYPSRFVIPILIDDADFKCIYCIKSSLHQFREQC